jgi:hypothetical protein
MLGDGMRRMSALRAEKLNASKCFPLFIGGLNRSTQHFILEGKDGVWDGTKIS